MSYTAREFSHAAKKWLLLLLQKYRGKHYISLFEAKSVE